MYARGGGAFPWPRPFFDDHFQPEGSVQCTLVDIQIPMLIVLAVLSRSAYQCWSSRERCDVVCVRALHELE